MIENIHPSVLVLLVFAGPIYLMIRDLIRYRIAKRKEEIQRKDFQQSEKRLNDILAKMKEQQKDLYHSFQEINKLSKEGNLFNIDNAEEQKDKEEPSKET